MTKNGIQVISHCGKDRLVGINGKDIRKSKTSGGSVDGVPFMAIGNEEIDDKPQLPTEIPCDKCGTLTKVITLKPEKE